MTGARYVADYFGMIEVDMDDAVYQSIPGHFGWYADEKKMHIHDFHATLLHLMGIDHEKLTFRYSGRDFRLTDVHGEIAHEIIS